MGLNALGYCLVQTFVSIRRNFWLNLASAAMITVSLLILGAFVLVALNASQFLSQVESEIEINAYLEDSAQVNNLIRKARVMSGVEQVNYVTKEQALEEMRKALGERRDVLEGLEEDNPLPNTLRVQTDNAAVVPAVARAIEALPGVNYVRYGQGYVERLVEVTRWVNVAALVAAGLLLLAAVFLIMTTIRLSVLARQDEVEIMKYMGAGNWFIRFPFLLEGMLIGLFGSLAAVAVLGGGYHYLLRLLEQVSFYLLSPVTDPQLLVSLGGGMLALGVFIGGVASALSIRKYLKV